MSGQTGRSPWIWIGCGCGGAVLLVLGVIGAVVFFGWQTARSFERGFADPAGRRQAVGEILDTDALPDGYHAIGGVHIPLFVDIAVLSDREPTSTDLHENLAEHTFVYVEAASYLRGRGSDDWDDMDFLDSTNIRIHRSERLVDGEMELDTMTVRYASFRGEVEVDGEAREGVTTLMRLRCNEPPDRRRRFGIWIGPDPGTGIAATELDLTGTTADPDAIRAFLGHFGVCG